MSSPDRFIGNATRDVVRHSSGYITGNTLDLGAGTAKYKQEILKYAQKYTAFDVVAGPNIDITGDIHATGLPDASFDTIICTQVLEHVRQPWLAVKEMKRLLKPGGKCIFTVPFMMPFHADPYDYFRYTLEGGCSLFENEGFTIIEKAKYGSVPVVFAEMWKFTFCSPYIYPKPGFIRRNIFRVVHKFLLALSKTTSQKTSVYANIYIVAQKL